MNTWNAISAIWLILNGIFVGYAVVWMAVRRQPPSRIVADIVCFGIAGWDVQRAIYCAVLHDWFDAGWWALLSIVVILIIRDRWNNLRKKAQRLLGYKAEAIRAKLVIKTREVYA